MSEQSRDRIGQYAATAYGEPAVALPAAPSHFGHTTDELNAMSGDLMGPAHVRQCGPTAHDLA